MAAKNTRSLGEGKALMCNPKVYWKIHFKEQGGPKKLGRAGARDKHGDILIAKRNFRIRQSLLATRAALPGNYFWQPF